MSSAADVAQSSPRLAETPDIDGAYPRLNDHQIVTLEVGGRYGSSTASESDGARLDHRHRTCTANPFDDELDNIAAALDSLSDL